MLTRGVKSYVLRQGRITTAQRRALSQLWQLYGIGEFALTNSAEEIAKSPLDWSQHFNRAAPLSLEIGAGYGEVAVALANAHAHINHLAVEVHPPAIGALLNHIEKENIKNIRIIRGDIVTLLPHIFADESIYCVRIFFPDPWPKKRHHKRRLIDAVFINMLSTKIQRDGFIHIATDWQHYGDSIVQCLQDEPNLQLVDSKNILTAIRPPSRFANRAIGEGRAIQDFIAVRV